MHIFHRYKPIGVLPRRWVNYVHGKPLETNFTRVVEQCVRCKRTRDTWTIEGDWTLAQLGLEE